AASPSIRSTRKPGNPRIQVQSRGDPTRRPPLLLAHQERTTPHGSVPTGIALHPPRSTAPRLIQFRAAGSHDRPRGPQPCPSASERALLCGSAPGVVYSNRRTAKKKAARLGQTIVFVDESGLSERPHRCRTWAPRGLTPVLQYHFNWKWLS